ncbi:hypothetical protein ASPSYDRAFT_51926 [Aspergillus sydowii CBS 593.65]|uniref:Uncharacterized protein n=1 Tax=Aspergillus sydowii CBS 593.65 TaxID=1036612 RepID=A0A1L9SZ66_9EURO|nr:uncharacterized protein ASPSYDRAFT_51926 [Aspergillus sydowii CBS 593.65]OJJ52514.1 hypothetical protein ASPSYDRAFT_51926 [Aspergillus sydowii CBS 593.65]
MAATLKTILFLLTATSATVSAEHLKVVFSAGDFGAIGGSNGNYASFAIINDNGDAIYNDGTPADRSPCYNTGDGREFTIEGDCWSTPRTFKCKSDFAGHPSTCEVKDGDGNSLGTGEGVTNTNFVGIAIGEDSTCVVEFDSDDGGDGCPVDDGNGPLHVTSG